jgi:hypothetical protein
MLGTNPEGCHLGRFTSSPVWLHSQVDPARSTFAVFGGLSQVDRFSLLAQRLRRLDPEHAASRQVARHHRDNREAESNG